MSEQGVVTCTVVLEWNNIVSVDAKSNTLESKGKCSLSSEKLTKYASQFDLQLTKDKQKLNLRAYRLGFRIYRAQTYREALPIEKTIKEY